MTRLLTTKELARMAGVTAETVRNWKHQGLISPAGRRNGRDLLWSEEALRKVLASDQASATVPPQTRQGRTDVPKLASQVPFHIWIEEHLSPAAAAEFLMTTVDWLQRARTGNYGPRFVRLSRKQIFYVRRELIAYRDARLHQSTAEYKAQCGAELEVVPDPPPSGAG